VKAAKITNANDTDLERIRHGWAPLLASRR
jgi:hypothetical protein